MNNKLFLFFLFMFIYGSSIKSQTCCSGGVPLSNNIGLEFLKKGDLQFGFYYDYNNLNTLNEGSEKLNDNSRLRTTNSLLINFSYNISDKFLVEGLFTWVNQKREIKNFNSINVDETNGVGDGVLLLRYLALNKKKYSLSFGLGGKLPIGSSKEVNTSGILLNADLQPGSNAFDGILTSSLIINQGFRPTMSFLLRTTYRESGTNRSYQRINSYKFGNEFQAFVGVSDSFLLFGELFNPSLVIKYRNAQRDEINNNEVPNTGGNWFFLNPSVTFQISPQINLVTRVELPIYSNVNGLQLTPSYRINVGLSIKIPAKKLNLINYETL